MAEFIVRVELHYAVEKDYENLHSAMGLRGFSKTIYGGDGVQYNLPQAEYFYNDDKGQETEVSILMKTQAAASSTKKVYSVLVTKSAGIRLYNLTPTPPK